MSRFLFVLTFCVLFLGSSLSFAEPQDNRSGGLRYGQAPSRDLYGTSQDNRSGAIHEGKRKAVNRTWSPKRERSNEYVKETSRCTFPCK